MKKDCLQCGKQYEAKRLSSKFCGATCRSLFRYHKVSVQEKEISVQKEVSVQDESLSVQITPVKERPANRYGYCEKKHRGRGVNYLTCGCYQT
jgi:hypothetical protein